MIHIFDFLCGSHDKCLVAKFNNSSLIRCNLEGKPFCAFVVVKPMLGVHHRNRRARMRGLLFCYIFRGTTMGSQDGGRWLAEAASGGVTTSYI